MHKILLLLFLLPSFAFADEPDSVWIMGWPRDAFTMEPVIDGTVVELLTEDSVLIETVAPQWDEHYRPNSTFSVKAPSRNGTYIIRITHPQYITTAKKFTIKVGKRQKIFSVGGFKMRQRPVREVMLDAAEVRATKIKFYTHGDTLIYNADAFNLAEGSMLDALIEQLPGAELKRDGRIFVNGKQVESLLLNGKDFFKDDNTVLLDNLPAYTVSTVQVYNRQSEMSEMLGREVDEGSYVMDIKLKRQYQVGWLGNAEVAAGTDSRWLARLFALRFTPQSRISVFANLNNVNESRKPGRGGEWSPTDIGGGLYTTKTGGLDYMVTEKYRHFELEGEVHAQRTDNQTETRYAKENFLSRGSSFGRGWYLGESSKTFVNTKHKFRFNLGPEDAINNVQLFVRPNFSYTRTKDWGNTLAAEFNQDPTAYAGLKDSLSMAGMGAELTRMLVNRTRQERQANGYVLSGGGSADINFRIPYTSDGISVDAGVNASRQTNEMHDLYQLDYASNTDRRRRYFDRPSDMLTVNAGLSYSYALDRDYNWVVMPRLAYTYKHVSQENSLYRLDRLEEMADAAAGTLPSTREALLSALDADNSYMTTNDVHELTLSLRGRWDKHWYENGQRTARWRFTWDPRLTLIPERLLFEQQTDLRNRRTEWLPSLRLELLHNTRGMKHEWELLADFRQTLPAMFSLLGLRFDSDPLNITEGNAGLQRTAIYSFTGRYRSDQWLKERQQTLSANVTVNLYHNSVATGYIYNKQTGVRTYQPENVNGNWDAAANIAFSTPIGQKRSFEFRASLSDNYYNSVDLTGIEGEERTKESTVRTNYLQAPLSLEYSREKMRIGVKARLAWNNARSQREGFSAVNAADLSYGVYGRTQLPWKMELSSDLTYYTRYGYADEAMNSRDLVWNAQLTKSVLHGNLMFSLVGFDILGRLSNITYTLSSQARVEAWRNVIPRYGMLRMSYRLNVKPKKK